MKNRFKNIDLIKFVPEEYKESTYLGVCSSLFFILIAGFLIFYQFAVYINQVTYSEIEVDHFKDDKDLTVHLAMRLPKYPCSMLSLDKLDKVRTHTMDVEENLQKIRIDSDGEEIAIYINDPQKPMKEKLITLRQQIDDKEGCYLKGNFTIKLVPGNFHISFHAYFPEFQHAANQLGYTPDFSHKIEHLYFGDTDEETMSDLLYEFGLDQLHTLKNQENDNIGDTIGYPHGVVHRLNIVPSKFIRLDGTIAESYQFNCNTRILKNTNNMAMTFEFDLENLKMVYHRRQGRFSHFVIQSISILGGLYMIIFLIKSFIEDGLLDMIYKRRIGKLE